MASKGINKVILIGNLGQDPETRYTQSGDAVTNFSVATSESWKGQDGNMQERTEWHRIVAWRKLGEICGEYLRKGSKVYLEGKLQTRKWQDQSGADRYSTEIVINQMQMLDSRQQGQQQGGQQQAGQGPTGATGAHQGQHAGGAPSGGQFDDFDDDIPF